MQPAKNGANLTNFLRPHWAQLPDNHHRNRVSNCTKAAREATGSSRNLREAMFLGSGSGFCHPHTLWSLPAPSQQPHTWPK